MSQDSIPFRVYSLPNSVAKVLSRPYYDEAHDDASSNHGEEASSTSSTISSTVSTSSVDILSPSNLSRLRDIVQHYGSTVPLSRIVQAQLHDARMQHENEVPSQGPSQKQEILAGLSIPCTTSASRKRVNGKKSQATSKPVEAITNEFETEQYFAHIDREAYGADFAIDEEVSLCSTTIGPSGSSKLDYILTEVCSQLQDTEARRISSVNI